MRPMHQEAAVVRRGLLLIVGLMAVSTVLFVVGVAVERRGEATEGTAAHQELSSEPQAGEVGEGGEEQGAHQKEASSHEEGAGAGEHREESIFGVNPDATWVVIAVVLGWTVLAAGLLLLGPRVLIIVALAAAVAAVLDLMEVMRQLALANGTVAILAILVALSHVAIGVLAVLVLRRYGGAQWQQGGVTGPT
jgi:hypothetical protein